MLDITYYENIAAFFNCITNGKLCADDPYPDTSEYDFYYFSSYARKVYTEPNYANNAFIFFGSETKGLDEELLYRNPEQCVRFPMLADARCLNLSSAIAIGTYEVLRQWGFPKLKNYGKMADARV